MTNITPCVHKVQYYETDQMQIVHHSNYIRWFEEARTWALEDMGFDYAKMEDMGIIIPVLGVEADYKNMTYFGETVVIQPVFTAFNGVKMTISYEVRNQDNQELKVVGQSRHCFLDKDTYKPINLKRHYPDLYQLFVDYAQ